MAPKKNNSRLVAVARSNPKSPCIFCNITTDNEILYGKMYSIGDISCHYFCVLSSCCLVQNGNDDIGVLGFLYPDIVAEVERGKKCKCSYCGRVGATVGCNIKSCRKQFHVPCGRERNAVTLFFGNFATYCKDHAPKQKISANVMEKVCARRKIKSNKNRNPKVSATSADDSNVSLDVMDTEMYCVICYEKVPDYPCLENFWPPCCAKDAWFHRTCLQRMALSAGMHYLKCPLCNDKEIFYEAVVRQGIYVPDRDAAWELEHNAFAEIYERPKECSAPICQCYNGRSFVTEFGDWDLKLCLLCGSSGMHEACLPEGCHQRYVCDICNEVAPPDLDELETQLDTVVLGEPPTQGSSEACSIVMPSRMSLRRTKPNAGTLRNFNSTCDIQKISVRQDSIENTKSPVQYELLAQDSDCPNNEMDWRYMMDSGCPDNETDISPVNYSLQVSTTDSYKLSSLKLVDAKWCDKISILKGREETQLAMQKIILKMQKPRPMAAKKKIVDDILQKLLLDIENNDKAESFQNISEQVIDDEMQDIQNIEVIEDEMQDVQITTESMENVFTSTPINTVDVDSRDIGSKSVDIENDKWILEDNSNVTVTSDTTWELPQEFVAETRDDSLTIFEIPKKIDIENSSIEFFKTDENLNVTVTKIEAAKKIKFSPMNETILQEKKNIDMELFKSQYLSEVDNSYKCAYNHKHQDDEVSNSLIRSAIDFALEAAQKKIDEDSVSKENFKNKKSKRKIILESLVTEKKRNLVSNENKKRKKYKKISIRNEKVKLKIKWGKEKFKVQLMEGKRKNKTLTQTILNLSPENSPKEIIMIPENAVLKHRVRQDKNKNTTNMFKQTSIANFFSPKIH